VTPLPTPLPPQSGCATASTAGSLCIVILGDSIGQGVPVTGDDRWWIRLQRLLATALPGRTVTIDNWAVSGSQVGVLESAPRDQPEIGTYDIAIIIEGVNDVGTTAVPTWRPHYEAAVAGLEAKGVIPVLTTPPPEFHDGTFGDRYDATAAAIQFKPQAKASSTTSSLAVPGALEDLGTETLRVLHDESFRDDPTRLFRLARYAGRLGFGLTPDEAFYVKCDRETNPAEGIDAGQVVCQIGIAPVKPAEFVVFRIAQFSGGAAVSE